MDLSQFYYIPLKPETKTPALKGHSWPIDPVAQDPVRTYEEVQDAEHEEWGVVGNRKGNLLIVDIDLYKMDERTRARIEESNWRGLIDQIPIIKTPSGGIHLYFECDGRVPESIEYVDIKGDKGKGFGKAPFIDEYEIVNDTDPLEVDTDTLLDFDVFKNRGERLTGTKRPAPCLSYAESVAEENELAQKFIAVANKYSRGNYKMDSVYEILDKTKYPVGKRTRPPSWFSHDSSTESNFMVKDDGDWAVCWRHENDLHVIHLVGIKEGIFTCEDVDSGNISSEQWMQAKGVALNEEGIKEKEIVIKCEDVKEIGLCPYDCKRNHPLE